MLHITKHKHIRIDPICKLTENVYPTEHLHGVEVVNEKFNSQNVNNCIHLVCDPTVAMQQYRLYGFKRFACHVQVNWQPSTKNRGILVHCIQLSYTSGAIPFPGPSYLVCESLRKNAESTIDSTTSNVILSQLPSFRASRCSCMIYAIDFYVK